MLSINQQVPLILAIIAGLAMIGVTSWQGYDFWHTENDQTTNNSQSVAQSLADEPDTPSLPLATIDFFGNYEASETEEENTENLPETNLRLFLRGVLASEGDFPGSALIENDKNKTEAYLVGDELPGNAKLRSVHSDRVIIDRAGKLENLYFPEEDASSEMAFSPATDEPGQEGKTPAVTSQQPVDSDQQRREQVRKRLEQLRERLRTNG